MHRFSNNKLQICGLVFLLVFCLQKLFKSTVITKYLPKYPIKLQWYYCLKSYEYVHNAITKIALHMAIF